MAKAKTVWRWKAETFSNKKELLEYLKQRAREAVTGPPADEMVGDAVKSHSVNVKIQLSLGVWPPRNKRKTAASTVAVSTAKKKKPAKPLPPLRLPAMKKGSSDYFGV